MFSIFLFCLFILVSSGDSFCRFDIGGDSFDLSGLESPLSIDLEPCGLNEHKITFDACKDLSHDVCRSTESTNGNGCDIYNGDDQYFWIGSPDSSYVKHSDVYVNNKYSIYYQATNQLDWKRDLNLTMICDHEATTPQMFCSSISQYTKRTVYSMVVRTMHACPTSMRPSTGWWVVRYSDNECSKTSLQMAEYFEPECFDFNGRSESCMNFYCDGNTTFINQYVNQDNCEGTPTRTRMYTVGECSYASKISTNSFCTGYYTPEFKRGKFFIPLKKTNREISDINPLVGELHFPVTECVESITNPGVFIETKCNVQADSFTVTLFHDSSCSYQLKSKVVFAGQVEDMGPYFYGDGKEYYMVSGGCFN